MKEHAFLPYGKQSISQEDINEVVKSLNSPLITRGPKVEEFEQAVAKYCGVKYAVAFSNGTSALMGACRAAEMDVFDRLITSPNTFVATVGAGILCRSTPVFVDIDPSTGNLDLEQVEHTLSRPFSRGKDVLIPVHFSGISVDMKKLDKIIKKPEVIVIEDAAHAFGSKHLDGSFVGSCKYSHMTVFSFHPVKNITTGEGGMVTTNDKELFHRLKRFRNNGIERDCKYLDGEQAPWYYEVKEVTGNYNFTDFQAALGLSQLKRLDKMVAKRRKLVLEYRKHFKGFSGIRLFTGEYDSLSAYHLFVVQIDFEGFGVTRTDVMKKMMDENIGTQLHYIPVYRHPFFQQAKGDISAYFPKMERYFKEALSLPLFYDMEIKDVQRVTETLKEVLTKA